MLEGQMVQIPLYLDWAFWSVAISVIAVVFSQLPPVHILLRRAKLDVEAYSRLHLTHTIGNPNVNLHLIINNIGGREIKVKKITLDFQREKEPAFTIPAQGYFQMPTDKTTVLLTSFKLKPKEEWAHMVQFFPPFSRKDEKEYKQHASNLKQDLEEKQRKKFTDPLVDMTADAGHVAPLLQFFKEHFQWMDGEYELTLKVETEPKAASLVKKYRITLFESDSKELEGYCDDYKYGLGVVYFNYERHTGITVPLIEA
jgi:hypothetical protein